MSESDRKLHSMVLMVFENAGHRVSEDPIWIGPSGPSDYIAGHIQKSILPSDEISFYSVDTRLWEPRDRRKIYAAIVAALDRKAPKPFGPFFHNLSLPWPPEREPQTLADIRSECFDIWTGRAEHLEDHYLTANAAVLYLQEAGHTAQVFHAMSDPEASIRMYAIATSALERRSSEKLYGAAIAYAKSITPALVDRLVSVRHEMASLETRLATGWGDDCAPRIAAIHKEISASRTMFEVDAGEIESPALPTNQRSTKSPPVKLKQHSGKKTEFANPIAAHWKTRKQIEAGVKVSRMTVDRYLEDVGYPDEGRRGAPINPEIVDKLVEAIANGDGDKIQKRNAAAYLATLRAARQAS